MLRLQPDPAPSPPSSPAGTIVGQLTAVDPGNYTISNYSWVAVDTPNAFAVTRTGALNVTSVVDTLALSKNAWTYTVSVCDPYICGRCERRRRTEGLNCCSAPVIAYF